MSKTSLNTLVIYQGLQTSLSQSVSPKYCQKLPELPKTPKITKTKKQRKANIDKITQNCQ